MALSYRFWCPAPDSNRHGRLPGPRDFKSENDFTKQHSLQSKARKAGDFRFGVCPCLLVDSGSWQSNGHSLGAAPAAGGLLPFFHRTRAGRQKQERQISQRPFSSKRTQGLPTFRTKGSVSRRPRGSTCTGSAHIHVGLNSGFTPKRSIGRARIDIRAAR